MLQKNVKYVFVLFQENRSFDLYFGRYSGRSRLDPQPVSQDHGLRVLS